MPTGKTSNKRTNLSSLLSSKFFKAMGDPNRIAILCYLSTHCTPLTVRAIAEHLPVDVSVVSRHLSILRDAGILIARKKGKEVHYSLNTRNLISSLRSIADAFEACCPEECLVDNQDNPGDCRSDLATGHDSKQRRDNQ